MGAFDTWMQMKQQNNSGQRKEVLIRSTRNGVMTKDHQAKEGYRAGTKITAGNKAHHLRKQVHGEAKKVGTAGVVRDEVRRCPSGRLASVRR